jgi:glycosyltransferase involved in cell wall biosynthesis
VEGLVGQPGLVVDIPRHPVRLQRVETDGKFLSVDGHPFHVRGVTYGSFSPRVDGEPYPERERVVTDFRSMAAAGVNTIRTYTLPPDDVLDAAAEHGLRVLCGLDYRDWRYENAAGRRTGRRVLDQGLRAVHAALVRTADRPEVLAIAVGNEVPADLVRFHGIRSVEHVLSELASEVGRSGSGILATYANYPTTEYLEIGGQDVVCFNVFLEEPGRLAAYLRHLQVIAGDAPLLITELGLASEIHGPAKQAEVLAWQLRLVEEAGCAGATVFSWTDDWSVGGNPVDGWGFGVTDAARRPKPALDVVTAWTQGDVEDIRRDWPRLSVVVCARNEEALIGRCLASLERCPYPSLEVIVCDDGSTDRTLEIANGSPFIVLALDHGGLSRARNEGAAAATGSIVAYLDADAECHPEWPYRLALAFRDEAVAAAGGPNLAPYGPDLVDAAVAAAPGGPIHVLVSDDRAEHIPGCNMAIRRSALDEIGGFDPIFMAAGDDVDVCWKLLDRGWKIAYAPGAQVWHHRPETVRAYLRQQVSYGRAEGMLRGRYRHHFNALGQARWSGFLYTGLTAVRSLLRPVVYHGSLGLAPFQPISHRPGELVIARTAPLIPIAALLALIGIALTPVSAWMVTVPAAVAALVATYAVVIACAVPVPRGQAHRLRFRLLVAGLHIAQPLARTWGRLRGRPCEPPPAGLPLSWRGDRAEWLSNLQGELAIAGCRVTPGGPHDTWDVRVAVGPLLSCRLTTAVAWNWLPLARARSRPSAPALVLAVPALAAFALGPIIGAMTVLVFALAVGRERVRLRRAVRRAVELTTPAAAPDPSAT